MKRVELRISQIRNLGSWLTTDAPNSQLHARIISAFVMGRVFMGNPLALTGLVLLLLVVVTSIFAPLVATHDPFVQNLDQRLLKIREHGHLLGTDELGRDIFSRIVFGSRITLYIVALVILVAPIIGLLVGTIAGYAGGVLDMVLMRMTDVFLAFPRLVLALAFVAALGAGIENAILAIVLTAWPPYARLARAETLALSDADFVNAARLQGAGPVVILIRHVWPLCMSSLVVRATLDMAGVILIAAGLGFLGLGAQPPAPEWGAMISSGRKYILDHWWVATMPGLAIFVVSLAFNLLGDGLRDILDPKTGQA